MKQIFCVILLFAGLSVFSQDQHASQNNLNLNQGVALSGYDPVTYLNQNKAVKGSKDLSATDKGASYYFSTAANRDEFKKNPSKYEPQYGEWCAYAMGKNGTKVEVDPETFKIIDGKLFLFYNRFFNNTLNSWNKDESNLHQQADQHWRKFTN